VVAASVAVVDLLVTERTRNAFERMETLRTGVLVEQFQKEFERRKQEIVRAVDAIAESEANIAAATDFADQYETARRLASTHGLDLLELVAGDGTIVSSSQWQARFGYKEDWLTASTGWKSRGAFFRREELPEGMALTLVAVGVASAGDRTLYVPGGQIIDQRFLSSIPVPQGMRVLLYRNLAPQFEAGDLLGAKPGDMAALRPLVEQTKAQRREAVLRIGSSADAETVHALPFAGLENDLAAVLLIASSRRDLVELEAYQRRVGALVAAAGILLGIALAWWAAAHVTRPVHQLAVSAGKVAAGNWDTTVETASRDEIGQLALAFNRMTHELVAQRERLVQAERVAAWRELARRLAHELKNPLFPLQITVENMQRARDRFPDQFDEVFREGTATLLAELANLKQIIARFSDFAKMPAPEMQRVDMNQIAADTLKLFDPQFANAHIHAKTELDPALPAVQADPEQMTRVLRNLILNAIDAMPEGGTLTVRTSRTETGIRLEVSDTGQGLTPEECDRLFTPYYTTKTHGTGLGLAIVQSVISDHHGRISVESQPGKGATFRIELG
jgi:signal transduction histidine kinase